MKRHYNFSLEHSVADDFKKLYPRSASEKIEDYMRNQVLISKGDVKGINVELERAELEKAERKLSRVQNEVSQHRLNIEKWEKGMEVERVERLKVQKRQVEARLKCGVCDQQGGDGREIRVSNERGNVCRNCFMTSSENPDFKRIMGLVK